MDIKEALKEHLNNHPVMQLATVWEGRPQLCSVHVAFDEKFNFYWTSSRKSRHSQAVEANGLIAMGTLLNEEKFQCFHAEGKANALSGEAIAKAHEIYSHRFGANPERLFKLTAEGQATEAIYKFTADRLVLIDPAAFPDAPRQEIKS